MKAIPLLTIAFLSGCSSAVQSKETVAACEFDFAARESCVRAEYVVSLQGIFLDRDEKRLEALNVKRAGKSYLLKISPDTTMVEGDRGMLLFQDINFDGVADIAVTTSFGVANLYLDYWVYDSLKDEFTKIGNYAQLSVDPVKKMLRNEVKINAATYERNVFVWKNGQLIKSRPDPGK